MDKMVFFGLDGHSEILARNVQWYIFVKTFSASPYRISYPSLSPPPPLHSLIATNWWSPVDITTLVILLATFDLHVSFLGFRTIDFQTCFSNLLL